MDNGILLPQLENVQNVSTMPLHGLAFNSIQLQFPRGKIRKRGNAIRTLN